MRIGLKTLLNIFQKNAVENEWPASFKAQILSIEKEEQRGHIFHTLQLNIPTEDGAEKIVKAAIFDVPEITEQSNISADELQKDDYIETCTARYDLSFTDPVIVLGPVKKLENDSEIKNNGPVILSSNANNKALNALLS